MSRKHRIVLSVVCLGLVAGLMIFQWPEAEAQKVKDEVAWEYKVVPFAYNPGERLTDEQRAAHYEKLLNDQAKQGWEPVGSLLSRDTVQTVGGAVTTRETVSFVTYRRPKR